jgi:hypothetical protein
VTTLCQESWNERENPRIQELKNSKMVRRGVRREIVGSA